MKLITEQVSGSNIFNDSLIAAVEHSDIQRLHILLKQGASANAREKDIYEVADFVRQIHSEGRRRSAGNPTALMHACADGNLTMVKTLLEAGADVDARNALRRRRSP